VEASASRMTIPMLSTKNVTETAEFIYLVDDVEKKFV
jgi:hypothetical protein